MKNKPTYPVGLSPETIAAHKAKMEAQAAKAARAGLIGQSDAAKKKKKKKNKSKSASADKLTEELANTKISESEVGKQQSLTNNVTQSVKVNKSEDSEVSKKSESAVDPAKRLKNLKKKMREIETLELKIKSGEIKHPEKEMLEKVSKKAAIQKEIKKLEASQ